MVLISLGMIGLALVGVGSLVAVNWDAVSNDLQATLFRLGELMSISAELKAEYGAEPDMAYDTGSGGRILSITFSDYQLPQEVTAKDHAREIAAFAIGKTTKFEQIDTVKVLFASSSGSFSFALDELMPAPEPRVRESANADSSSNRAFPG